MTDHIMFFVITAKFGYFSVHYRGIDKSESIIDQKDNIKYMYKKYNPELLFSFPENFTNDIDNNRTIEIENVCRRSSDCRNFHNMQSPYVCEFFEQSIEDWEDSKERLEDLTALFKKYVEKQWIDENMKDMDFCKSIKNPYIDQSTKDLIDT